MFARRGRDERIADAPRAPPASRPRPCRGGSRRRRRSGGPGSARQQPADAVEVVGAVPDLERSLSAPLEPARQRDGVCGRRGRPAGRGTSPPRQRPARGCCDRSARPCRRPTSAPGPPTRARRGRRSHPARRPRASPRRSPPASRRVASVCSSPTFVSTTTGARRTFVASSRPPSPASTTATSTPAPRTRTSAAAVSASNWVAPRRSAAGRTRATARSNPAASVSSRSCQPDTCGEVYAPTRSPSARRSAAVSRVVVDLPFVPTTWIDGIGELRVAELGEQRAHPVEPELLGPR